MILSQVIYFFSHTEVAGAVNMAHVSTAMQLQAAAEQRRRLAVPPQQDPTALAAWARKLAISVGFAEQWRLISSAAALVHRVAKRGLGPMTSGHGLQDAFLEAVVELKEVWDAAFDLGRGERGPEAGANLRNFIQLIVQVTRVTSLPHTQHLKRSPSEAGPGPALLPPAGEEGSALLPAAGVIPGFIL